jgi:hypothetical protein
MRFFPLLLTASFHLFFSMLFGQQTINPVLGDSSYLLTFGNIPDDSCDEQLRIKTHLAYTEHRLRTTGCGHLTLEQQQARYKLLDLLHDYRQRGRFPMNTTCTNERRPCFIDEEGTICAVGYLVEQTAGRAFAERINDAYQYDVIADMQLPDLARWAEINGLTLRECAMIQPTYAPRMVVVPRGHTGWYAGYTSAFAKNSALCSRPGFEIGGLYWRDLRRHFQLQGGLSYVLRGNELRVGGAEFDLRNERWSASLLLHYHPSFESGRARRFSVKAGLQVDFYNSGSPVMAYDAVNDVRNKVLEKRSPELLAAGELVYRLRPLSRKINNWISVAYLQGMRPTFHGEVVTSGQPVLRYTSSGSYLSVRYTFSFVSRVRQR